MTNIQTFMAQDHLHCDGFFTQAERLATAQDWDGATAAFAQFKTSVLQHFDAEENLLFPAFEDKSGMRMGPTQVMRDEHAQMRQLMDAATTALSEKDGDDYEGYAETLLIMMQQHNLKEENVLYPMCDQHLQDQASDLVPRLRAILQGKIT
jgi:iron-sulfur cluster repair protein YtfE (RIC family)